MGITIDLITAAVLLIGGVSVGVLAILAIVIHGNRRSRRLSASPRTYAEHIARKVLGVTVRTGNPSHGTPGED